MTGREGVGVEGPAPSWTRREVVGAALVGVVLATLLWVTANPGPSLVNDTRASALASWTLGTRGELALPDPWPASRNYWGVTTPDGRVHVNRFPGVALWATPAYAVHHLATGAPDPPAHPFLVPLAPAAWTAALTVAAALAVAYVLLRRSVPWPWAAGGTLLLGLATSLWSVAADALWPHGPGVLALLTVLLAWRRGGRADPALAGVAAAVVVLVRPHLAVATVVVGAGALLHRRWRTTDDGPPREVATSAAVLAGTAAGLGILTVYTGLVFGTWLPTAGYDVGGHLGGVVTRSAGETARALGLAFVGRDRGVLVWSPVVAVALAVALAARRHLPAWTVLAAGAGLAYLVVQVRAVGHLGGAGFFGPRISLEVVALATPLLVVGCWRALAGGAAAGGPAVERRWLRRGLAGSLAAAALGSVAWHGFGAVARSTPPEQLARWEAIDVTVQRDFGHLELGEVDLREGR